MLRCAALLVLWMLAVIAPALAADADMVENPPYKNWSAFKEGTLVKLKRVVLDKSGDQPGVIDATGAPSGPHVSYTTYKLISVTPEKAVVEMTETDIEGGNEVEHPSLKITYRAQVAKKYTEGGVPKADIKGLKEGDEKMTVAGHEVDAHWVESEFSADTETSYSKVWASDQVPGGTVKKTTIKKENGKTLFETEIEVVELDIKK